MPYDFNNKGDINYIPHPPPQKKLNKINNILFFKYNNIIKKIE